MALPDERPPKPILNPIEPPLTQRERLEREQAEMRERQSLYPRGDDGGWDKAALFIIGSCTLVGALVLLGIVYYFLF